MSLQGHFFCLLCYRQEQHKTTDIQPIPPQATSDIVRGMGLLNQNREGKIK